MVEGWCRHCGYREFRDPVELEPWSECKLCGVEAFAGPEAPDLDPTA